MLTRSRSLLTVIALIAVIALVWLGKTVLEGEKPDIRLTPSFTTIGKTTTAVITITDRKSGLRNVTVTLKDGTKEHELRALTFPSKGHIEEIITLEIKPREVGFKDGKAVLAITATDFSIRKNSSTVSLDVTIDTMPPRIYPLWSAHYINIGGVGVTRYRLSEGAAATGVEINGARYRGYRTTIDNQSSYVCYFACPLLSGREQLKIGIVAEDEGGNRSFVPLSYIIKSKEFRNSVISLDQKFLDQIVSEFQDRYDAVANADPVRAFIYINETLRADTEKIIASVCRTSSPKQLWEGTFLRMKNGAPMALFGDKRTYMFNGRAIGASEHLGIDLASTENAAVEAANSGIVAYADYLGIYGNAVIIDHGQGLFSLYGHLSAIQVQKDQTVKKGDVIGRTGMTGFAGGDHLHYSILVGPKFVNPTEWWDPHWIEDNVTGSVTPS
jgi:murein DD-endopeptidase MepM/ murein hydrolase activator NlpD